jgi:hypothetical protein
VKAIEEDLHRQRERNLAHPVPLLKTQDGSARADLQPAANDQAPVQVADQGIQEGRAVAQPLNPGGADGVGHHVGSLPHVAQQLFDTIQGNLSCTRAWAPGWSDHSPRAKENLHLPPFVANCLRE